MRSLVTAGLTQILQDTLQTLQLSSKSTFHIEFGSTAKAEIVEEIEEELVPLLLTPALDHYRDNFYLRSADLLEKATAEYYESLVLFAIYTFIFMGTDLVLIWMMKYGSIDFIVITLDQITNIWFSRLLLGTLIIIMGLSLYLARYALRELEKFFPFIVPYLFYEPAEDSLLRKESIRNIAAYNYDNLLTRKEQYLYKELLQQVQQRILSPLLFKEISIESRRTLAARFAFQKYSSILAAKLEQREQHGQNTKIDRLLLGESIGELQLAHESLLGLNADFMFVRKQLGNWNALDELQHQLTFLYLYRICEVIIRAAGNLFIAISEESSETNYYESIRLLKDNKVINLKDYGNLNNFRYLRNKLIHEPGVSINVSQSSLQDILRALHNLLDNLAATIPPE